MSDDMKRQMQLYHRLLAERARTFEEEHALKVLTRQLRDAPADLDTEFHCLWQRELEGVRVQFHL